MQGPSRQRFVAVGRHHEDRCGDAFVKLIQDWEWVRDATNFDEANDGRFFNFLQVCQISIGAQTPAESSFTLLNEGSPGQVRLTGTAKGITYATSPESANTNCGLPKNNAEIVLALAIKGYSDEALTKQVSFRVE